MKLNFGQRMALIYCIYRIAKTKNFYVVNQSGKISWPLKYQKLEEVHNKIHNGEITLLSYDIDKLVPTWGNYIAGLFKHFGCDKI